MLQWFRLLLFSVVIVGVISWRPAYAQSSQTAPTREWLIMLYQNADDPILEGDIFTDLNEAEWVGSNSAVTIVSQLDRYDGEFAGDGDWTGSKRFLISQDRDLTRLKSKMIKDLGEVDSGAPETLIDFAVWAMKNYPAKKYALILSDHGAGWVGGWNDSAPNEDSSLTINEIDQALATILQRTKVRQFEFLGFDACLMSEMEVLAGIAPYAHYAAASQETEPALGWAYSKFLSALTAKPTQSGAELATSIVKSYIVNDLRIVDDRARANYLDELGAETASSQELAAEMSADVTLTAVDLSKFTPLMVAFNDFALALTQIDPTIVAQARTYAQSFESVFDPEYPAPYIDLGHFAKLTAELANSATVDSKLKNLQKAYNAAILTETNGDERPGASGISIFFPTPELLEIVALANSEQSYTGYASRFVGASLWDDFLRFHYTNQDIDPDAVALDLLDPKVGPTADLEEYAAPLLDEDQMITTPGVEQELAMTPLDVSEEEITVQGTVALGTQIHGDNVGYIYIEVTRYDEAKEAYVLEDMDFIASDRSDEVDGVAYPMWTNSDLDDFLYEWSPTVYSLSDGKTEAFALFEPEVYGKKQQDTEYVVRGIYRFANSRQERYALIHFDGDLNYKSIFGFQDLDGSGAPREITPRKGDQFTILEQWYTQNKAGEWMITEHPGETLTFSGKPLTVIAYEGYAGEYSLGIIVEDLLGNRTAEYATVQVVEK